MCELNHHDDETERVGGISDFIDELVVAVTSRRIYWAEHPRVRAALHALAAQLEEQFALLDVPRVEIGLADGYLFFLKRPLLGASLSAPRIIRPLAKLRSGGLQLDRGVTADDLLALVEMLAQKTIEESSPEEANATLARQGCQRIRFLPRYDAAKADAAEEQHDPEEAFATTVAKDQPESVLELDIPLRLYQDVVYHLQDVMVKVCRGDNLSVETTRGFVEGILRRLSEDAKSMMSVGRYEQYDAFTFGHSIRVCFLALNFAQHLTRDEPMLHRIGMSALLHDVGKAWVPFEVLHSKGRLTADERVEMNRHTSYGAEMLLDAPNSDPMAVSIAFGHHRTTTGGGYPDTLHRPDLSLATKIVKICDVYEALTAVRPYKPRMSPTRAYRIMIAMQDHFDAPVLKRFIQVNGIYPTGTRVRLSDGSVARVERQTKAPLLPVVDVEVTAEGRVLPREEQRTIDLNARSGAEALEVTTGLLEAEYA